MLSVSPLEENITGQTQIEEKAKEVFGRTGAEILYVDMSLTKYTYEESDTSVSETQTPIKTTEKPLKVMLQIPEELQTPPENMNRTFRLLCAHELNDGTIQSSALEADSSSGDGKLYFSTDRFSTYAIAYVDIPLGEALPTAAPSTPAEPSNPGSPWIPAPVYTPTPVPTSAPDPTHSPSPEPTQEPTPAPTLEPTAPPDETVDHIVYIYGHNGQFRPNEYLSRAEAAQIFYRLLTDKSQAKRDFDDISESAWYREPVSVLAGLGIVEGVGNNHFDPNRPVTRAEFAAMTARFMGFSVSDQPLSFPDIPAGAWYSVSVAICESKGWINGYPDGMFHPTERITRAQAVTIVNRMAQRAADEQAVAEYTIPFSDVPQTHWAYNDITSKINSRNSQQNMVK